MAGVIAQGAEEFQIALQTPTPKGKMGVPCLLWGKPGTGKTSFVEGLARPGFPVVTLIASIHDPTDFSGLPLMEQGGVRFVPPAWTSIFENASEGGLLFGDELTTAPPSTQAALLRIVLERQVGEKTLPDKTRVAAAANYPDEIVGGYELSPALANRFVHLDWQTSGTSFAKALVEGFAAPSLPDIPHELHAEASRYWRMLVAGFLQRNPTIVETQAADGEFAFASPRSWDFAIQLAASCDVLGKAMRPGSVRTGNSVFLNLMKGTVGTAAATALLGFLKNMRLPDPEKLLSGKATLPADALAAMQDDELYVLFCALSSCMMQPEVCDAGAAFVDAAVRVLSLVGTVAEQGRIDTVYAPIRQIVRGQILQKALVAANDTGRLPKLQRAVQENLQGELAEFIGLMVPPKASRTR